MLWTPFLRAELPVSQSQNAYHRKLGEHRRKRRRDHPVQCNPDQPTTERNPEKHERYAQRRAFRLPRSHRRERSTAQEKCAEIGADRGKPRYAVGYDMECRRDPLRHDQKCQSKQQVERCHPQNQHPHQLCHDVTLPEHADADGSLALHGLECYDTQCADTIALSIGGGAMAKRRTIWVGMVSAACFGIALVALVRSPLATVLIERMIERRVGRNSLADLPDGVHVLLCGTGSPLPDPTRAEACTAVLAGKHLFVVDAGDGGARKLALMGVPMKRIERVFLTHFHSDHIDGLGPLMLLRWTGSAATAPLPVAGPPGVAAVVAGFNAAYAIDAGYRVAHHGAAIVPPRGAGAVALPFALPAGDGSILYRRDGVTVTAFMVNHAPVAPAIGYRFAYGGRSVTLSGDTAFSPRLVRAAHRSDLLVHEALQPRLLTLLTDRLSALGSTNTAQITRDIRNYHSTPEQAADAARLAGVRYLVLNHIVPPMPLRFAYPAFLGEAHRHYAGRITVGEDGMLFSLPAGGTTITRRALL